MHLNQVFVFRLGFRRGLDGLDLRLGSSSRRVRLTKVAVKSCDACGNTFRTLRHLVDPGVPVSCQAKTNTNSIP